MDIGELRATLVSQYIDSLDEIMMRNFGMAYNPELKIYE